MKKNKRLLSGVMIALAALASVWAGGCGGGGGAVGGLSPEGAPAAGVSAGNGQISVRAVFPDLSAGRAEAGRGADASSGLVTVTITVTGYMLNSNQQFPAVTSVSQVDLTAGAGKAKVLSVPVGKNHIISATADWGYASATVKGLITEVSNGAVKQAVIDSRTTAIADAVVLYSNNHKYILPDLDPGMLPKFEQAVDDLSAAGVSYSGMTGLGVIDYMEYKPAITSASISISPATASVTAGAQQAFTATVYDTANATITSAIITWSVSPAAIGTISSAGLFTAGTAGSGTVTASYGAITATRNVTVTSAGPVCGNSAIEAGETCDSGASNTNTPCSAAYGAACAYCNTSCQTQTVTGGSCGDGSVNGTEACDSGASNTNTACSAAYGGTCSYCNLTCQTVTVTGASCGDSTVNGGETCDAGASNGTVCSPAYGGSCSYCSSSCQTQTVTGGVCGDGTVNGTETCDSGASNTNTPCSAAYGGTCNYCNTSCQTQTVTGSSCGDGTLNAGNGEVCDSGASNTNTPCSAAYGGTCNYCNTSCQTQTVTGSSCGDGTTNAGNGETCDSAGANTNTPCTAAYGATCNYCNTSCLTQTVTGSYCGDGTTDAGNGETCDSAGSNTNTPCSAAYGGTCNYCNTSCQTQTVTGSYCGDGTTDAGNGETCDAAGSNTNTPCTAAYGGTCNYCNTSCASQTVTGSYCGDGTTNAGNGETCDAAGSNTNTPCTAAYGGTCNYCNTSCASQTVSGPSCGDGILQAGNGEVCDDANTTSLDGCSATCAIETFTKVDAGNGFACGLLSTGAVACWGYNNNSQTGDGTYVDHSRPTPVQTLSSGVVDIAVGGISACALMNTGGVKCWGSSQFGVLGNNYGWAGIGTPMDVTGLTSGVAAISMMAYSPCALMTNGEVKCWGFNYYGAVGDGTNTDQATPVSVQGYGPGQATATAIMTGYYHACAMGATATRCWGMGTNMQLGNGVAANSNVPVDLTGYTPGPTAMSGTWASTCFLTAGGGISCLGDGSSGQLGNGGGSSSTLVSVTGLSGTVTAIEGEGMHMCALITGGGMQCWGQNTDGRIGDGTTTDRNTATQVTGYTSGILDIAAGNDFSCAVVASGQITCWGNNTYGQLGNGTTTASLTPVIVGGY